MVSKEEYHASGTGDVLSVMPIEPGSAALLGGTMVSAPSEESMSIKTNPRLARCLEPLRGLRSLIVNSFHP